MTTVIRTLLVLLGLILLAAEPVLGGRRSRDRRRRRRRTRAAKCVAASAYNVRIKSIKKEQRTDTETIQAESDEKAYDTCFVKCIEMGQKMQFFVVKMPEENESNDYDCYCTRGKLKKTSKGGFEVYTGPLDLDSGTLLVTKSKKYLKGDARLEGDACQTTLDPVPAPTESPTPSPTETPTMSPTLTPLPYESDVLFKVSKGGKVDASKLWTGAEGPSGGNFRSDKIDNWDNLPYQEISVMVYKDNAVVSNFLFANTGGQTGWFSYENLVLSNYPDLNAKPEFFILNTWDETTDGKPNDTSSWLQQNWDGKDIVSMTRWFSEEDGGMSDIKSLPMVGMACDGGHCDNKKLRWTKQLGDIVNQDPKFIKEISEEGGKNDMRCPQDRPLVCKIQCTGANCDNMKVHCCTLKEGWRINYGDVAYSGWFSDESPPKDCGGDRYTAGLKCSGSYCDNVEMYCLKLEKYPGSVGRDFYITKSHGGCEKDNGWLTIDSGADKNRWDPCEWEDKDELAIYYAPNNQLADPYLNKAAEADYMTVQGLRYKVGYNMVYQLGTDHEAQFNFFEGWMSGGEIGGKQAPEPSDPSTYYRSSLLDTFMKQNKAGKVKIELYAEGKVVKTIEFMVNPGDASTNGWMTQSNILSSDWAGVKPGMTSNFFSVQGDEAGDRSFFIQKEYGGCEIDNGWLVVQTKRRDSMCPWEAEGEQPMIYYAPGDETAKWQSGELAQADSIVVSVDFQRAIPYIRKVKGCVSGANIVKTTMRTVAECARECNENDDCVAFEYGVNYGAQNAYAPYDCQLQSSADSKDCNGAEHNLDLYVFDGRRRQ